MCFLLLVLTPLSCVIIPLVYFFSLCVKSETPLQKDD